MFTTILLIYCYNFSLSNLSAYLISSYLGALLIFSHNNLHIVRLLTRVRLAYFARLTHAWTRHIFRLRLIVYNVAYTCT